LVLQGQVEILTEQLSAANQVLNHVRAESTTLTNKLAQVEKDMYKLATERELVEERIVDVTKSAQSEKFPISTNSTRFVWLRIQR